jgi:hypothetical protein
VNIFLNLLAWAGLAPLAIGLFVLFHVFRPQRPPADESNRINKIRLVWFALTREELFTKGFPWLTRDELDNLKE